MMTPRFAGRVRLGVPVDLISGRLLSILRLFAQAYPDVEIDLVCQTSPDLRDGFEAGSPDVTLLEEVADRATGRVLYRDRLVWFGARRGAAPHQDPLSLSLISKSCVFRPRVLEALDAAARRWKYVYKSDRLEATIAMIRVDLAVGTFLASVLPDHVEPVGQAAGLPELPVFAVSLLTRETVADHPTAALSDYVARGLSEQRWSVQPRKSATTALNLSGASSNMKWLPPSSASKISSRDPAICWWIHCWLCHDNPASATGNDQRRPVDARNGVAPVLRRIVDDQAGRQRARKLQIDRQQFFLLLLRHGPGHHGKIISRVAASPSGPASRSAKQ